MLLNEYYIAREDEQQFQTILATMISVAVALLGAIIVVFYQSCDLNPSDNCLRIRPIVYVALPFGPLVVLAYIGVLSNVASARSFYLRALERQLHEYADGTSMPLGPESPGSMNGRSLPVPMFMHLVHVVTSQRHGFLRYRYLTFLFYMAMAVMFFGVTATSLVLSKSGVLQGVMGLAYGVTTVVFLIVLWSGSVGGRGLWGRLIARLDEARKEPLVAHDPVPVPARLWAYLALPRPAELVAKGVFIPLTVAIAASVLARGHPPGILHVLVFVVAFEYFMYQARYMLNDIRNLDEDARDPLAEGRNRLPQPMSGSMLNVTLGVLLMRVLLWAVVVAWLWRFGLGAPLLISGIIIFLIAGLYEQLRDRVRASTKEGGENILGLGLGKPAIYIVVGFGYALRAVTGIWIGSAGGAGVAILALTVVSMSALGTMFVAMTWVVMGTSFIESLRVLPTEATDGGEQADLPHRCSPGLIDKSHYGPLLAQAGLLANPLKLAESVNGATSDRPFLRDSNRRLNTIWNIALVASAGCCSRST